jgi:predicted homoserine dehydrogenase-like protein
MTAAKRTKNARVGVIGLGLMGSACIVADKKRLQQ